MPQETNLESAKGRHEVQVYFWNIVGSVEHINLPKLKDALRKKFHTSNDRFIDFQVRLMQTEGRIRVQNNAKVWIKQPNLSFEGLNI
jgi:hypothetical protein